MLDIANNVLGFFFPMGVTISQDLSDEDTIEWYVVSEEKPKYNEELFVLLDNDYATPNDPTLFRWNFTFANNLYETKRLEDNLNECIGVMKNTLETFEKYQQNQ